MLNVFGDPLCIWLSRYLLKLLFSALKQLPFNIRIISLFGYYGIKAP
jgi:hypothetical protein